VNEFDWGYVMLAGLAFSRPAYGLYLQRKDEQRLEPRAGQPTKPEEFSWLLHGDDR
jgi:hypothetical protein